jgi:hypothetical protein
MKKSRKLFVFLSVVLLLLAGTVHGAGTVTASSQRDSLSFPFFAGDSANTLIDLATTDSVWVLVFSPGGDSVFSFAGIVSNGAITTADMEADIGDIYCYTDRVLDLIGSSTSKGVYSVVITALDLSLDLTSTTMHSFQLSGMALDSVHGRIDVDMSSRGTSDLVEGDNIGINADDVTGDFTSADFETDFLDDTKVAANFIGSSELATTAVTEIEAAVYANRTSYMATLTGVLAAVDTLSMASSLKVGSRAVSIYAASGDTLHVYDDSDVLMFTVIAHHPGGTAGGYPDSVTVVAAP